MSSLSGIKKERVQFLRTKLISSSPGMCAERARYYTQVYRQFAHELFILLRIRALKAYKELKSVQGVSLLAYHTLGAFKYNRLGKSYSLSKTLAPSHQYLEDKIAQVNRLGVPIIKFNG